jgi:hypothetical protein
MFADFSVNDRSWQESTIIFISELKQRTFLILGVGAETIDRFVVADRSDESTVLSTTVSPAHVQVRWSCLLQMLVSQPPPICTANCYSARSRRWMALHVLVAIASNLGLPATNWDKNALQCGHGNNKELRSCYRHGVRPRRHVLCTRSRCSKSAPRGRPTGRRELPGTCLGKLVARQNARRSASWPTF